MTARDVASRPMDRAYRSRRLGGSGPLRPPRRTPVGGKAVSANHQTDKPQTSQTRRATLAAPPLLFCGCGCGQARARGEGLTPPPSPSQRTGFMQAAFAQAMDTTMDEYEIAIRPVKSRLFSRLRATDGGNPLQHILEIGSGTGPNLPFYDPSTTTITAVDPNPYMFPYMRRKMESLGWDPMQVTCVEGFAEQLPVDSGTMDAVICTLVLCSVADVAAVVKESMRVLRPGGQFLFIEHTGAQQLGWLKFAQWALDPLQQLLADGCHLTRDPLPVIEAAGFESVESERFMVDGMALIAPHVAGVATTRGMMREN